MCYPQFRDKVISEKPYSVCLYILILDSEMPRQSDSRPHELKNKNTEVSYLDSPIYNVWHSSFLRQI